VATTAGVSQIKGRGGEANEKEAGQS